MKVEVQLPIASTKIGPYSEYILKQCGMETEVNVLGVRGQSDNPKIEVLVKTALNWKVSSIRMAVESDNEEACKIVKMLLLDEYTYSRWYYETYSKAPKIKDAAQSKSEDPGFVETFIFDTSQNEAYYFMRWLLDDAQFKDIHGNLTGDLLIATYKDITSVSIQLIEDGENSTRCLIMSAREDMIKAFDELINKREFYKKWIKRYPFCKGITEQSNIPATSMEIQINLSLFEDFEDFLTHSLNPIGFIYKGAKLTSNTYYAQTPEGKAMVIKLLKGIRSPLTFSVKCESPEDLQTVAMQLSDLCVLSDWRADLAKKKKIAAEKRKKAIEALKEQESIQREKKETIQYEKDQKKLVKLQVDYYENLARCPKCGSTSLSGHKKGFGVGKALTGAALGSFILGPVGLLGVTAGNKGAKKLYVTCLNCGHKWKTKK
ncbi:hypothetical protein [Eubacterium limosum]|uniref:hypothetical protein n=1 Tax=Eubacterium limosum TaxID=1736 RepID=UPI00370FC181